MKRAWSPAAPLGQLSQRIFMYQLVPLLIRLASLLVLSPKLPVQHKGAGTPYVPSHEKALRALSTLGIKNHLPSAILKVMVQTAKVVTAVAPLIATIAGFQHRRGQP